MNQQPKRIWIKVIRQGLVYQETIVYDSDTREFALEIIKPTGMITTKKVSLDFAKANLSDEQMAQCLAASIRI